MFTSFHSQPPSPATSTARSRTPRRAQVRRACDFCRLIRAKCDAALPCRNCRLKGRTCIITTSDRRGRAVPQSAPQAAQQPVHYQTTRTSTSDETSSPSASNANSISIGISTATASAPPLWAGLRVGDVCYGPSSMHYFRSRLYTFLGGMLRRQKPDLVGQMLAVRRPSAAAAASAALSLPEMPRSQQGYYLSLWWLWHHPLLPILSSSDFRAHCDSLWATDDGGSERPVRKPSALVDIVLALCIQFSSAYTAISTDTGQDDQDGQSGHNEHGHDRHRPPPGYAYFVRSRMLCEDLSETPSLAAVQCGLLSAQYLDNCGLPNSAHSHVMVALRTAVSLGMHYAAAATDAEAVVNDLSHLETAELQQVLAGRLWVSLTAMDADLGVRLGRPRLRLDLGMDVAPLSSPRMARVLDPTYADDELPDNATWLTYHDQCARLVHLVSTIHADFYQHCEMLFRQNSMTTTTTTNTLHTDPSIREAAARFLVSRTSVLYAWAGAVPISLQAPRSRDRDCARPFDATSAASPLDLCPHRDPATPLWLHRQRLMLELRFHHALAALLFHPFVAFSPAPATNTPTADSLPIAAVRHAVTLCHMARQALAHTACLQAATASADVARWLHDVALVMIGFMASYPVCPPSALARSAIGPALEALEMCGGGGGGGGGGKSYEVAELRRLVGEADDILGGFRGRRPGQATAVVSKLGQSESGQPRQPRQPGQPERAHISEPYAAQSTHTHTTHSPRPHRTYDVLATPADSLAAPIAGETDDLLVTELQGPAFADLDPVGNAEFWACFMQELDTPAKLLVPT